MSEGGKKPYLVKKGRVDEDYHIRSINSSLRMMNRPQNSEGQQVSNGCPFTISSMHPLTRSTEVLRQSPVQQRYLPFSGDYR